MESRYLFRAKRIDTGEWAEGYLVQTVESSYIVVPYKHSTIFGEGIVIEIDPSTICQCTGYAGIYEKDIFQWDDEMYVIEWSDYSLSWEAEAIGNTDSISLGEFEPDEIYAIGNTIDNPELLEV